MRGRLLRLPEIASLLLCALLPPLALPSDGPKVDEAAPDTEQVSEVKDAAAAAVTDAASDAGDEQTTDAVATTAEPEAAAEELVCRKETPTGSHRSIKTCRRRADIEANSAEVEKVMNRQRHYGNPSVTPQG